VNADEVEDVAVSRATVINQLTAALASAALVAIYVKMLLSDDVKLAIKARVKRWRVAFFGPPPLSEEQIKEAARQVEVEANRVLRYEQ